MFPDHVAWIKAELAPADRGPTVKYVVVYMQEPMLSSTRTLKSSIASRT
jgi:hypothetical protein